MNKTFDPDKPVQTRDGRKARIICKDMNGSCPIASLILIDNKEKFCTHHANGKSYMGCDDAFDLINIPSDHDKRMEVAKLISIDPASVSAICAALRYINWPACADRS